MPLAEYARGWGVLPSGMLFISQLKLRVNTSTTVFNVGVPRLVSLFKVQINMKFIMNL